MRSRKLHAARGFTGADVMVLLTIVTLLAVIAMIVLAGYERRAKTVEAVASVTAIGQAAARYYDESDALQAAERRFPPSSQHSVPPSLDMVRGKQYASGANDWAWSPWRELKFGIPQPQYYAYSFNAAGRGAQARATAQAQGDLDGDGRESMFMVTVTPDAALHAVVSNVDRHGAEE